MSQLIVIAVALAAASPSFDVTTLDGTSARGELVALAADGVTLTTGDGQTKFGLKQLLKLQADPSPNAKPQAGGVSIDLVDGSRLVVKNLTSAKGPFVVVLPDDTELKLPAGAVRAIRFLPIAKESASPWQQRLAAQATADLIAVRKKGAATPEFLEGVVAEVTGDAVHFDFQGEKIPVKRDKVEGVIYYRRAGAQPPVPLCIVEDSAGWRLKANQIALREGMVEVTTTAGVSFKRPLDQVRLIDFSAGKVTYLSDLEPESVEWTPFIATAKLPASFAQFHRLKRDRGQERPELLLGGKAYQKGLSLRSRTIVVYRLPSGSRWFLSLAGIDDQVGNAGSVILQIEGDGKKLFEAPLTGQSQPVSLDLDVSGVRRLKITVDFGGDGDIADHLNLCEARVTK